MLSKVVNVLTIRDQSTNDILSIISKNICGNIFRFFLETECVFKSVLHIKQPQISETGRDKKKHSLK